MASKRASRESEPKRGDEVPWHCLGMGPSRVVQVERKDGRWTRVKVQWQAGCEPVPSFDGQPMDEWRCPRDSEWLTRHEFEERHRQFQANWGRSSTVGDECGQERALSTNGVSKELLRNLQLRAARAAITASASRRQGVPGIVKAAREFVGELDLARFVVETQPEFMHQLDDATERLRSCLPRAARRWGLARKLLNIFLRDCTYTHLLRQEHGLGRVEGWLEVPLDSYTAKGLRAEAAKLNQSLPRWRGVKCLEPGDSAKYQDAAAQVAARLRIDRVHLDAYWWGARDQGRAA